MSDEQLVQQFVDGDTEAFNTLAQRHQAKIYRVAYRLLGNHEDAQDAVQEVLLRLLRALPKFKAMAQFSTWLYRVASNTCIDMQRRKQSGVPTALLDTAKPIQDPREDLDQKCEKVIREQLVHEALQLLPEGQRLLVVLRDREELSNTQVAEILGLEIGVLKSRLHRARGALRKVLESGVVVKDHYTVERFQVSAEGIIS